MHDKSVTLEQLGQIIETIDTGIPQTIKLNKETMNIERMMIGKQLQGRNEYSLERDQTVLHLLTYEIENEKNEFISVAALGSSNFGSWVKR